ncbi:MAG: sodium:solute symporter family protein [Desulfurococcaceae archaeon]
MPLVIILVLVVLMSLPGLLAGRYFKPKTLYDYMVAGRTLGLLAIVLSVGATQWSALSFMGFIGFYYIHGMPGWLAMGLGYMLISVFLYGLIGLKVNELAEKHKLATPSDFVHWFYKSKLLSATVSLLFIIALLPYMQAQIGGVAYILQVASGGKIPFIYGALLCYILVSIYVWIGGLKSVAWANIVQGAFFLGIAFAIGIYMWNLAGGASGYAQLALSKPEIFMIPGVSGVMTAIYLLSWSIPVQFGWPFQPQIFMQFAAAKKKDYIVLLPIGIVLAATGLYFLQQPLTFLTGWIVMPGYNSPDKLLLTLIYNNWGAILYAFVGAAGIAAMTSTLSTQALSIGSLFVNDLLVKVFGIKINERTAILATRIIMVTALFAGFALWFIYPVLLMTMGALSSCIGVLAALAIIPSLYGIRFVTKYGALSGIVAGFITLLYTEFINKYPYGIYSGGWGIIVGLITSVIISILTKKSRPQPQTQFPST